MVLHHVADRARRVVVGAAPLDAERLGDGDLHVIDMGAVPYGLEQCVGQSQRHQILDSLLAQIMIDAKNIALEEHGAEIVVDRGGAGSVLADWLFHDDARAGCRKAVGAKPLCDRSKKIGTGGEVVGAHSFVGPEQGFEIAPAMIASYINSDIVDAL